MPSVETIYRDAVRPLPVSEQVRLAELIMKRARTPSAGPSGTRSSLDYLTSLRVHTATRSASEIDDQLKKERESWDD